MGERRLGAWIPALAGWAAGMALAFRATLLSGFARVQGEPIDTRLIAYILEHGYRWLAQRPTHERLWSPPVFFPAPNTLPYSDTLLTVAPVYWVLRWVGLAPETALQGWAIAMATLTYAAGYLLLRRVGGVSGVAAALGALLLAFGGVRIAQFRHAQLIPHVYTIVALFALSRLLASPPGGPRVRHRWGWPVLLVAGVVAQLYASFYYGWLLLLALAIAGLWALASPAMRRRWGAPLRAALPGLAAAALAGAALLLPLATHGVAAARTTGYRAFPEIATMLPRPQSWLYLGPDSWLYHRLATLPLFHTIPMEHEQRIGLGLVTTACAIAGLWWARRRLPVALLALTALTLVILTTCWPGGWTVWWLIYRVVPGAGAVRAVSRVGLVLLIPAAVGVALFIHRWRRRRVVTAAAILLVLLEQGQGLLSYDKARERARGAIVAAAVPHGCRAFLFTALHGREDPWRYHVDAMWAQMALAIPTINGYSGRTPPSWPFYDAVVRDASSDSRLDHALAAWLARWQLAPGAACRVTLDVDSLAATRPPLRLTAAGRE